MKVILANKLARENSRPAARLRSWTSLRGALAVLSVLMASAPLLPGADFPVGVGRPAPAFEVGRWLKGKPIDRFAPDQVYVIETWASWCAPCARAIPHLTELQRRYAGRAAFVGVDIWEQDGMVADRFVAQKGDQMDYAVVQDAVPPGATFFEGKFAKGWVEAAGKYSVGVPLTFVIDRSGRIAWIGHPMDLDDPLDRIITGRWDLDAAAGRYDEEMKETAKSEPFKMAYYASARRNDWRGEAEACESLLRLDPERFAEWAGRKYAAFALDGKRPDLALRFAREALDKDSAGRPRVLAELARAIARSGKYAPDSPELELAGKAADRALSLAGEDNSLAMGAAARVLFAKGDKDGAIALQRRAVDCAKTKEERADMQELLDFMLKK